MVLSRPPADSVQPTVADPRGPIACVHRYLRDAPASELTVRLPRRPAICTQAQPRTPLRSLRQVPAIPGTRKLSAVVSAAPMYGCLPPARLRWVSRERVDTAQHQTL